SSIGSSGAYLQMFSHGVVLRGLYPIVDYLERYYNVKEIRSIGGIAIVDPAFAVFFTFFGLANVSLPLTSSFLGVLMMFTALFEYNVILCISGCAGVLLSAAYTLRMSTAMLFGEKNNIEEKNHSFSMNLYLIFGLISILILILGIYPSVLLNLFK